MHCAPNVELNHFAAFNEFAMLLNSLSQLFFTFIDRLFCFHFKRSRFREAIQTGLIVIERDLLSPLTRAA